MRTGEITQAPDRAEELELLFRREAAGLWRALLAFTGGRSAIAEEALAEAFARALAHEGGIREPLRWIYRVAIRLAIDDVRRESRWVAQADAPSADAATPTGEVWLALRGLSPKQRVAIVMRYEMDLPIEEIAARMGVAQPTVRVHLFRGRKKLRELLGGTNDE